MNKNSPQWTLVEVQSTKNELFKRPEMTSKDIQNWELRAELLCVVPF